MRATASCRRFGPAKVYNITADPGFVVGDVTTALTSGSPVTTIDVGFGLASDVNIGDQVILVDPTRAHSQTFIADAANVIGDTTINVDEPERQLLLPHLH